MSEEGLTAGSPLPSNLGGRLRELRLARSQSLTALAKAAGTSASFLSQVERHRSSVSLVTLQRVADALGVTIADLFDASGPVPLRVQHLGERHTVTAAPGVELSWISKLPMRHLEVCHGVFQPRSVLERLLPRGDSQELLLVEAGLLHLTIGGAEYEIPAGASIEYSSSMPYSVRNDTDQVAILVWIMTPPTHDTESLESRLVKETP